MKEEQPIFKVTDRRLFNADGTPRDIQPEEQPRPEAKPQEKIAESAAESPVVGNEPASTPDSAPPEAYSISGQDTVDADPGTESELDEASIPGAEDPASFINFAMS